jgi:3-oxoacyl-[acyl-carrier protein] reductase
MSNTYELAGRFAIVPGAAKGIGRVVAELILANRCEVCIWDTNRADVPWARSVVFDITRSDEISRALAERGKDRRIDILVSCAGCLGRTTTFGGHEQQDWRRIVDVNLAGTTQLTRALLPCMLHPRSGRVVNLGSLAGTEGLPGMAAHSAASAGVIARTKALSREIASEDVFVNCVAPGPFNTDTIRDLGQDVVARMIQGSPMGRQGGRDEVAHLVSWFCTAASHFNTGANFDMSGGRARN